MAVSYGPFNRTTKERALSGKLPSNGAAPTIHPYAALIIHLLMESGRYDHAAIMDDPRDLDRPSALRGEYLDRSIELRNEFVTMMGWQFKGLV